jgi:hypothetical protein
MPSLLADGPISPELVLVAPPEEAEEARAALPDVDEFHDSIHEVRSFVEPESVAEVTDNHGLVWFTLVVCAVALMPLVLIIVWRAVT